MRAFSSRTIGLLLTAVVGGISLWQCGGVNNDTLPVTTSSAEAREAFVAGRQLYDGIRFHEAQRYFEKAVKLDPEFAQAYLYLALSNPSARGFFENINLASKFALKASEGERLLIEANLSGANGEPTRQTELLVKLTTLYPRDKCMLMFLASQYFAQQQYDSTVSLCERIVRLAPDYPPPYNMLGYSYRFLDKSEAAGRAFKEYIRLTPNDPNPYDSYAELLTHEGQFEQAIEQYRLALQQDKAFAASRVGITFNLIYLGRYEEALGELQVLYDSAVNSGQRRTAILGTAVCYVDMGDLPTGLLKLQELFQYDSALLDPAAAANDLAAMLPLQLRLGLFQEAEECLRRSMDIIDRSQLFASLKKNAHQEAYLWQARILTWQGRLAEARQKVDAFLREVDPDLDAGRMRRAFLAMGCISLGEKDYARAIAELEQADPNEAFTSFYLARAYEGKGETAKAARIYRELSEAYLLNSVSYALVRQESARKAAELSGTPAL